jgi:hypothetical protein
MIYDWCFFWWKESLNNDGHQFLQYQQNEQSTLILTELTKYKRNTAYDVGYPGRGSGQAQQVVG